MSEPGGVDSGGLGAGRDTLVSAGDEPPRDDDVGLQPGDTVSRYAVLGQVGAGAMGVVYAAYDPELDRKIALKLLRPGRGARARQDDRARLLREAQAMARLIHPNVIKVHDVGTVEDRVFLAMEYVDGPTLAEYNGDRPRPWKEVVTALMQAGRGLAAAHRADLVHRDFKPENVLVGKDGRVRVTDFGLARPSEDSDTESGPNSASGSASDSASGSRKMSVRLTRAGAVLGTPAYMAPEQHKQSEVDARADQFSFCVALYESLYGERPFAGNTPAALAFEVLSGQIKPAPASSVVPSALREIVIRGLRKRRDDRWPDMEALLDALEPLTRRRSGAWWFALAAVPIVVLGAYFVREQGGGTGCADPGPRLQGAWDDQARAAATQAFVATGRGHAADTWERAEAGLQAYADGWVSQSIEACEATRVRQEQSDEDFDLRMACLGRLRAELGKTMEVFAAADPDIVDRAVQMVSGMTPVERCSDLERLRSPVPLPTDPKKLAELRRLDVELGEVAVVIRAGQHQAARPVVTALVDRARAVDHAPTLARALNAYGDLNGAEVPDQAAAALREAAKVAAEAHAHDEVALAWRTLMFVLGHHASKHDEALAVVPVARAALRRADGDVADTIALSGRIAVTHYGAGNFDEARRHFKDVLDAPRSASTGFVRVGALNNYGVLLLGQGEIDEAAEVFEAAFAERVELQGEQHPAVGEVIQNIGFVAASRGDYAQAREHFVRAIEIFEATTGGDTVAVARLRANLAIISHGQGRIEEAELHGRKALAIFTEKLGAEHADAASPMSLLAQTHALRGDYPQAIDLATEALAILERTAGASHPRTGQGHGVVGRILMEVGRDQEAAEHLERALRLLEAAGAGNSGLVSDVLTSLGRLDARAGRIDLARSRLTRARKLFESEDGDPSERAHNAFALAEVEYATDPARARALAVEARDIHRKLGGLFEPRAAEIDHWLRAHR